MVINIFATLSVVLVVGVFWVQGGASKAEEFLLNRISTQGQLVANNSTAAVMFEDWEEVAVIMSALAEDPAITAVQVIRGDQVLFNRMYHQLDPIEGFHFYDLLWQHNHHRSLSFQIDMSQVSTIVIQFHDAELHEALIDSLQTLLMMMALSVAISLALSIWMQSHVTKPIQHLSAVAKQVTQTKSYDTRGIFHHPDEVGQLTEDFNAMLALVAQKDAHMEDIIRRRTQLLEARNKELGIQITEREKSEQARQDSEEKFKQAFLNAPIGMALVNEDKSIIQHNRALDRMLETNQQSMIHLQDILGPNSAPDVEQNLDQLIQGDIGFFQREVECMTPTGKLLHAVVSLSAVKNYRGDFLYAVLQFQDITESKRLSATLEYQAKHDVLTGLANRRVLKQHVNDVIAQDGPKSHALCLLDLDQFKIVNDTCGHAAGDELLRQLGQVLSQEMRPNDLVVRLGGDEFAVVFADCDHSMLVQLAERLRQVIEHWEFNWNGQVFRVGVSIGAVIIDEFAASYSVLMQQADAACFIAKDMGRNQVYITAGETDQNITDRQGEMRWVQKIHQAIEQDQFTLFVQPVNDLQTHKAINKHEVLLRMNNGGESDLVPPGAFIPAAERYGLSGKIDRWVVVHLIQTLQHNPELLPGEYWVNLSGLSLGDSNFLAFLEQVINDSGLPQGTINFEITETAVMQNIGLASTVMNRLIKLGCRFALDDFGSGISSFGYLKQLPVSAVKIDGMFIRDVLTDEVDLIFVKSIIDIAKVMGIETVAEFVESDDIKFKLIEIGADYGQGFAIGKPQELSQLLDSVANTSVDKH
ncbi:bifunctional diguanylate cyclase/phosphodiesterase [Marinicella meishanensis]|uniref:bifunctional diguanylate cyclase/phosphodiesterase n=1 Tax=Marinicella meishanensis TaxID=2873263 RepID=UPI001CBA7505|nr:EAL domain-containing protein [Marinicella sp. NBU2979]